MMCENCVKHVEDACKKVNNVIDAKASLDGNNVVVTYKDDLNKNDIINNIIEAGYTAWEDK
jgi:copper chaperone CopZ